MTTLLDSGSLSVSVQTILILSMLWFVNDTLVQPRLNEISLKYEHLNLPVPRTVRNLKQDAIPDQNLPSRGHRCQGISHPPAFKANTKLEVQIL